MDDMFEFFREMSGKISSNIYAGLHGQSKPQQLYFLRQLQKELREKNNLETPLNDLQVVVFDLETTGFFPEKGDRAISLGAVKMVGPNIEEGEKSSYYSLIKTDQPISEEISMLTNIYDEQLVDAPAPSEVLMEFYKFVNSRILVAHHSNHEKAFMQKMTWDILRSRFEHRLIDTSFLIRLANPLIKSLTLDEVCRDCGIEIIDRHHALGDAKMTAKVWSYYVKKAQHMGMKNLKDIYENLAKL